MRALAIETSGRVGSIALAEDDVILAEEQFPHGLQHAAGIIPLIDQACRAYHWTPRDIETLFVSIGPGSFTGLRVAVTLAKTMAFATGQKIIAVPTVRVLVENAPREACHVIIVLDAKRDQIFTARFIRTDSGWIENEPAHLDHLASMLARSPRPAYLLGEGIPYHRKFVPQDDPQIISTAPETWRARAGAVALIGREMALRQEFTDPYKLVPLYIRKAEAEEKWDQSHPPPK